MNILWLSHLVPYPPKGGVLQRSYNLLFQTSRRHKIYLLAFNQRSFLPTEDKIEEAKLALSEFCEEVHILPLASEVRKLGKLRLVISNFFSRYPYDINWTRSEEMVRALVEILRTRTIGLVHFDTIGLAQYRHHVKDIPTVLNHHNVESQIMSRRVRYERNLLKKVYIGLESRKLRKYERRVCHEFFTNLTVSDLDGERLGFINPGASLATVANGTDIEYFRPAETCEEGQSLLFVGGLTWHPNRDAIKHFLAEVWPALSLRRPQLKLYIVGNSPDKEIVKISKNHPNVLVTGFVDDVRVYFRKATVFICPMRAGGGTRLKIIDALASGKPIVATSMACEGIDVTNGKNVLIADNPSEFCSAIETLLTNSALRASLAVEGRRLAEEKYSWGAIGKKLCEIYKSAQTSTRGVLFSERLSAKVSG